MVHTEWAISPSGGRELLQMEDVERRFQLLNGVRLLSTLHAHRLGLHLGHGRPGGTRGGFRARAMLPLPLAPDGARHEQRPEPAGYTRATRTDMEPGCARPDVVRSPRLDARIRARAPT